jgi:hypothetical protein
MLSSVPARFRTREGRNLIGYQPGNFVVDSATRAAGLNRVGYRLVRAIMDAVALREHSFLYAYPNHRSIGIAERAGFVRVLTVPTHLFPGFRVSARIGGSIRSRDGVRWVLQQVRDPVEAREAIVEDPLGHAPGFIRDRANFEWRFGGPAAARYTLVLCRAPDPVNSFVIACTEHRMKGFPFTVLVDGYPASFQRHFDIAVRAASMAAGHRGLRLVYVTTNLASTGIGAGDRFPTGIPVPSRYHPRPFNLLFNPAQTDMDPEELRAALAMTGDWMGF